MGHKEREAQTNKIEYGARLIAGHAVIIIGVINIISIIAFRYLIKDFLKRIDRLKMRVAAIATNKAFCHKVVALQKMSKYFISENPNPRPCGLSAVNM
jgi:hypothetical protein